MARTNPPARPGEILEATNVAVFDCLTNSIEQTTSLIQQSARILEESAALLRRNRRRDRASESTTHRVCRPIGGKGAGHDRGGRAIEAKVRPLRRRRISNEVKARPAERVGHVLPRR